MAALEFSLLGPFEVRVDGEALPLRGGRQWALLALLLLNANKPVSIGALIDALWPDDPPETAANVLQVYVSRLRRTLGDGFELRTRARCGAGRRSVVWSRNLLPPPRSSASKSYGSTRSKSASTRDWSPAT